ncbi:MAG: cytochrome c biogenesis CcdA family protein [Pseudonocardia sp.]
MDQAVIALALVAGAVAAFNPCGFALLPAYLGLLVVEDGGAGSDRGAAMRRAVRFAAGMTGGFVAVFGLVGAVLAPLALSIERYLPIVTVVMGVVLIGLGGWLLVGRHLRIPGLAGHGSAPTAASWLSQVGYGMSFALASLSCTIAPFLAVTAGSLRAGGPLGVAGAFLAYALGMGIVVLVLALAVAAARTSVVGAMRRAGAVISRGSGALLLVAGTYVAWYGWFEIRVLSGAAMSDPVISAAISVQSAISRWVIGLGPAGLLSVVAGVAALLVTAALVRRIRSPRRTEPVG